MPLTMTSFASATCFAAAGLASYSCGSAFGSLRMLDALTRDPRIRATHPSIGRATVYRALEAQVEDGMASRFEREGHISAYIACDPEHHHHLVCTNCQRVEDVAEDVVAPLLGTVGRRHDFKVDHAALDFYRLCASCRRRAR